MDLPEITEARRLALQPGDALAICLDRHPDMQEAHEIQERVRAILGMDVPVLILAPGVDVKVIGAPQPGSS